MRFTRRSQAASAAWSPDEELGPRLRAELEGARWYQGKDRTLAALELSDAIAIPGAPGSLLGLVEASYGDGTTATYCMPMSRDGGRGWGSAAAADPLWGALARLAIEGASAPGEHGVLVGVTGGATEPPGDTCTARTLDADQSNTSVVLDDHIVLKCYRRLWPGPHPEQELLEGLTRAGSRRAPAFAGGLSYRGDAFETTVATAYEYVPGPAVGWEPAIAEIAAALDGPIRNLVGLAPLGTDLGRCLGELHETLREVFGAEPATRPEAQAARDRADLSLGEALVAASELAPELAALAGPARQALGGLDRLEGTPLQRIHGDLHVGQLVRGTAGIVALDFEGDPTLPTDARRRRSSPLVDVASLLLSLDHVAVAAARRHGFGRATPKALAWSTAARDAVLEGYGEAASLEGPLDTTLLYALQVEKEWRELAYAARVLPEWLYAPRHVLPALLATEPAP